MMCLNMDRNSLWGVAGGIVFEHPTSWDVQDRYNKVREIASDSTEKAMQMLLGKGSAVGLFNPMNEKRTCAVSGEAACRHAIGGRDLPIRCRWANALPD